VSQSATVQVLTLNGRTVARLSVRLRLFAGGRRVLAGGRGQWVTPLAQDSWPQDWLDAIHAVAMLLQFGIILVILRAILVTTIGYVQ